MAEIMVLTLSHRWLFPKDYITQGMEGYWFFFFFFMTLTFWKTSPANWLVLSCLMWLNSFFVTWPLTHFLMLILKTQTNLFSFFLSFFFKLTLEARRLIRRPGQEVVSYLGAGVRTIIWGTLGDESQKKENWATQMSDVCILTPKRLSGFLCHRECLC